MPLLPEIRIYMRGLMMLMRGDRQGLRLLDISDRGMMRSFWAIAWCLPAMVLSWLWIYLIYSSAMPPSWHAGVAFFARLALVELVSWMVPLVLAALVLAFSGAGAKLPAMVTIVNWLALPFSWIFGFLLLLMLLVPGVQGLVALLWLLLLLSLIAAMAMGLRAILPGEKLLLVALLLTLVIPGLFLPEMLQRFLGVYPG